MLGEACIVIKLLKYKMFFGMAVRLEILKEDFMDVTKMVHSVDTMMCVSQKINSWEELPRPAVMTSPPQLKKLNWV